MCIAPSGMIMGYSASADVLVDNAASPVVNGLVHRIAMYVRFEYAGDYFRKTIPAHESAVVSKFLLFKGFTDVHTVGVKVGDVWGKDPETGKPLVFTEKMLSSKGEKTLKLGECFGYQNDIEYSSTGRALSLHTMYSYKLTILPKRNSEDNNNWWPSFTLRLEKTSRK